MVKKNEASNENKEVKKLVAKYEKMRKENKPFYMDGDQLAEIADYYALNETLSKAQEVITYGLGIHPGNTDLMLQQAYLYLDQKKYAKAQKVADLITDTTDSDVILLKAELMLHEGNLEKVEKLLQTLPKEEKESCEMLISVCYLYLQMGHPEIAISWLQKGLADYSEQEDFLCAVAECYEAVGKTEEAIFFYNKAIDKNPYGAKYWAAISKCYFLQKDFEKAQEAADFAIAADENCSTAYIMKAQCLGTTGHHNEAKEQFMKAFENSALPAGMERFFAGISLMEEQKWPEALQHFTKTIKEVKKEEGDDSPFLVDLYNNQGVCYLELGKLDKAHECLKQSIKLDPKNWETYIVAGRIYMEEDRLEEGNQMWIKALECEKSPDTYVTIAEYAMQYELFGTTLFCYEQVKRMKPDYPDIDRQLAVLYLIMDDHENFDKYNDLSGKVINLHSMLKDIDKAAIEINPRLRDMYAHLKQFSEEHDRLKKGKKEKKEKKEEKEEKKKK